PLEAHGPRAPPVLALPLHGHPLLARPVEHDLPLPGCQALPGLVEGDVVLALEGGGDAGGPAAVLVGALAPRLDGPAADGQLRVGDDEIGVDLQARAEAVAVDAHPER